MTTDSVLWHEVSYVLRCPLQHWFWCIFNSSVIHRYITGLQLCKIISQCLQKNSEGLENYCSRASVSLEVRSKCGLSKLLHIPFKNKWLFSYRSSCRFATIVVWAPGVFLSVRLSPHVLQELYRLHLHTQTLLSCVGEAVLVKLNDKQAASQHLRSSQLGCLFYDNWYRINVIHSILTLIFRFYFQCQYAKKEQCKIKHLVMNMIQFDLH